MKYTTLPFPDNIFYLHEPIDIKNIWYFGDAILEVAGSVHSKTI